MSHIATVELEVHDLDLLAEACTRVGLELVRGQQTYRWYGVNISNSPLPEGFTAADLGTCDHAIRVPGPQTGERLPYEIGVAHRRDGQPGYLLFWDFWLGGFGLQERAGDECNQLKQAYAAVAATREAMLQGFSVQEHHQEDGSIRLQLTR